MPVAEKPIRSRRLVASAVRSFNPSTVPLLSRRNYRLELTAAFFLPFLLAVVDANIIAVMVKNAFSGVVSTSTLNRTVAVLQASTAAANIVSFVWVRLSHARHRIRFVIGLQAAMIGLVGVIALSPRSAVGLLLVVGAVLLARMCWAGFVTIRTTIWHQNYERPVRARIAGKLATVQVLSLAVLGAALGQSMNLDDRAYRVLFPLCAAVSLSGVWAWSRVRLRGGVALLKAERDGAAGRDAPSFNPIAMVRLLRRDTLFARFMACMFTLGMGNLIITAPLVIILKDHFDLQYLGGIAIVSSLPSAMMPVSIPLWSRLLQRVHVVRFRAVHSWAFVVTAAVLLTAVMTHTEALLFVAAAIQGLAAGGGVLAWNLGHLDFAPPQRAAQYMGVHVTLTGVRGLIAPFLAVRLYEWFEAMRPGAGGWVFAVSLVLCASGGTGFLLLSRAMSRGRFARVGPVERVPPSRVGT